MLKGYDAKILADSIAPNGARLTTFLISIPKFIQAELNTHRMLSRNSASTRAVPAAKMRQRVIDDPVLPVFWGKNQAGMQAAEELSDADQINVEHNGSVFGMQVGTTTSRGAAREAWLEGAKEAVALAQHLSEGRGLHKQIANRVLEPFLFVEVVVSATEWANFWRLRCHKDAQPEFRVVAEKMHALYLENVPMGLALGQWHLPWIDLEDVNTVGIALEGPEAVKRVSVARSARLSYLTHEGKRDVRDDLALCERLAASGHWSPFEHVARPIDLPLKGYAEDGSPRCGNFIGWHQYRADLDPHFQW